MPFNKITVFVYSILVIAITSACSPGSKTIENYNITTDLTGLTLDKSADPILLYKRDNAPNLSNYNKFIIDPIVVNYNKGMAQKIRDEDINRVQEYFSRKMTDELTKGGYQVVTKPQRQTMRISLVVSNIKAGGGGSANIAVMASSAAIGLPGVLAVNVGEVTVEAGFRESITNRIDAVVVERSAGSRFFKSKPWSTWADVEGTFDNWAEGIREALDKAHGR